MGIVIPEKPLILEDINVEFLKRYSILPIIEEQDRFIILKSGDTSPEGVSSISRLLYKKSYFVDYDGGEIQRLIYKWYEAQAQGIVDADKDSDMEIHWDDPEHLKDLALEAPIIRLVNNYINNAVELGASDIHFEPSKKGLKVRFRIDGILYDQELLSKKIQPAVLSRIKLISKMNIAESRLPQDGRIKLNENDVEIDVRVSSTPTIFGESIVLRILNKEAVELNFDSLGMNNSHVLIFKQIISKPYGIILVTGPTGSGKTTTLYTALDSINAPDKKIITVEDPVEYQLEGINQIQVNPKIGLSFASALRSILRQDPDVILIGEIRDFETAEIAVQASLTGHLVFSTLHTNDAPSAITRLIDMGVEQYLLASSLLATIGQRLVRRICDSCIEEYIISPEDERLIREELDIPDKYNIRKTFKGKGCSKCANTGYRGRSAIYEIMLIDDELKRVIMHNPDNSSIKETALKNGMITMKDDGLNKILQGITTLEELVRVTR